MVGYVLTSPLFAHGVQFFRRPFKLVALGLSIWVASVTVSAVARKYGVLLAARACSGIGEASFMAIAVPVIDDQAPPAKKGLWIAIFFAALPVGYAAGYVLSGQLAGSRSGGWRLPYAIEGVCMVPLVLTAFFVPIGLKGITKKSSAEKGAEEGGGEEQDARVGFWKSFRSIATNKLWVTFTLGSRPIRSCSAV